MGEGRAYHATDASVVVCVHKLGLDLRTRGAARSTGSAKVRRVSS
jgi:hypothetical protein